MRNIVKLPTAIVDMTEAALYLEVEAEFDDIPVFGIILN